MALTDKLDQIQARADAWGSCAVGDDAYEECRKASHVIGETAALVAALRAVLDLHVPENRGRGDICPECSGDEDTYWPCGTVSAVESALGGAE